MQKLDTLLQKSVWEKEESIFPSTSGYIASIDEVGRGALFGPVTLGMVLWSLQEEHPKINGIRDSKELNEPYREQLCEQIEQSHICDVVHIGSRFIDTYNINRAIEYGIYKIVSKYRKQGYFINAILLDGNYRFVYPNLHCPSAMPEIIPQKKADSRFYSVAAASIVAKVKRDGLMKLAGKKHPQYGFERHKGYGTKEHWKAIRQHGVLSYHRKSFLKGL